MFILFEISLPSNKKENRQKDYSRVHDYFFVVGAICCVRHCDKTLPLLLLLLLLLTLNIMEFFKQEMAWNRNISNFMEWKEVKKFTNDFSELQ